MYDDAVAGQRFGQAYSLQLGRIVEDERLTADQEGIEKVVLWVSVLRPEEKR